MKAFLLLLFVALVCAWVYLPRIRHFKHLNTSLPNVPIKKAYYINLDSSVERKQRFLAGYNGSIPLERVSGVKVNEKIGVLGIGTRGCALAHAKAMNIVAEQENGWYLICEDDCVGDFRELENNLVLRNIVFTTSKQFINLGRFKWSTYSLSEINLCLQAYLLTPSCARKTAAHILSSIDLPSALPVDELLVKLYRTPRYFGQSGDGSGCHVRIFDAIGPSDITLLGR